MQNTLSNFVDGLESINIIKTHEEFKKWTIQLYKDLTGICAEYEEYMEERGYNKSRFMIKIEEALSEFRDVMFNYIDNTSETQTKLTKP